MKNSWHINCHVEVSKLFQFRSHLMLLKAQLEKGKPFERVGRKATGLSLEASGYGSRVSWRTQYPVGSVHRTGQKAGTQWFSYGVLLLSPPCSSPASFGTTKFKPSLLIFG